MKIKKNKIVCRDFSIPLRNYIRLVILLGFINVTSQIHVSENTIVSIGENTTLYSSKGFTESAKNEIKKIKKSGYELSFSDSLIQIVKLKTKKNPKEGKWVKNSVEEKESLPESPKNISKETHPFSLAFRPIERKSSDFFSSNGSLKTVLVQTQTPVKSNQSFLVKIELINSYLLNFKKHKNTKRNFDDLIIAQFLFEEHTTRPPPTRWSDVIV